MDESWNEIFSKHDIFKYSFGTSPFEITTQQIKMATHHLAGRSDRKIRNLCGQSTRESRPQVFKDLGLFLLPVRNDTYAITKGDGYLDIPLPNSMEQDHTSWLDFRLETSRIGYSRFRHLDFAFATSLIRTFLDDPSLVLAIRGRIYAPGFDFGVGLQHIKVKGVRAKVNAGYEGRNQIALVEAKNSDASNIIIKQLYYPFKHWKSYTRKKVVPILFDKRGEDYRLWQFAFEDDSDYNSIKLVKSGRFRIQEI